MKQSVGSNSVNFMEVMETAGIGHLDGIGENTADPGDKAVWNFEIRSKPALSDSHGGFLSNFRDSTYTLESGMKISNAGFLHPLRG